MCHRLTTRFFAPNGLVGSRPPKDSTVKLGWMMCHGLKYDSMVAQRATTFEDDLLCPIIVKSLGLHPSVGLEISILNPVNLA